MLPAQVDSFKAHIKTLVKEDTRVVFVRYEEPYDGYGDWNGPYITKMGPKRIVKAAVEEFSNRHKFYIHRNPDGTCRLPVTQSEVLDYVALNQGQECEGIHVSMYDKKGWAEYEEKKLREEAEPVVAMICQKYNVKPSSLAMVKALHRHYKGIQDSERDFRDNPERRAERWMDASYSDSTEGFWEDNDYASTQIVDADDKLQTAMRYLHRYCPLLMARWDEKRKK